VSGDKRNAARAVPALKCLLLVALAWSQLAIAAHQLQHAADEAGELCNVCLKFDREEELPTSTAQDYLLYSPGDAASAGILSPAPARIRSIYSARASPGILD